jgi:hypothetical protein
MNRCLRIVLKHNAKALCFFIGTLLLTLNSGCQIAPKDKPFKWPWKKEQAKPLPDRSLPVWTDSVLHQPNQPGVRGFGGRIYFYAKDNTDPIEIDGSLAVYVFDADDVNINSQKPLRKYVFTADQFNEHMSKTSIGPSYSLWLPWGKIGGPPRRLSLIARLEGREGGTTISDPTIKLLPGVPIEEHGDDAVANSKAGSKGPFRLSSHRRHSDLRTHNSDDSEDVQQESKSEIKTIELPPSFQRHLRGNASEVAKPLETEHSTSNGPHTPRGAEPVAESEQQLIESDEPAAADPITTQVYDYRTRKRQGGSTFNSPKNDIRQGRWIHSIARD